MSSSIFSTLIKRGYASITRPYIPPNLAALPQLKVTQDPTASEKLQSLIQLYRNLPKGNAPKKALSSNAPFLVRYREKYFAPGKESPKPLLHIILLCGGIGYTMLYFEHLSHHKQRKYH